MQKYASKEAGETEAKEGAKEETGANPETGKDNIKMLHEAAKKLKPTRPDLAKSLNKFAGKEEREMREGGEESREHRGDLGRHEKTEAPGGTGY